VSSNENTAATVYGITDRDRRYRFKEIA